MTFCIAVIAIYVAGDVVTEICKTITAYFDYRKEAAYWTRKIKAEEGENDAY